MAKELLNLYTIKPLSIIVFTQAYRCKMKDHYAQDSLHLFKACKELQKLKQTVSGYGILQQRVALLELEKEAMELYLIQCRQEIQELRASEKESYLLTQLKTQSAELDRGKTKIQFLEQRVEEMEDRFQAVGYALGFGDGKEQSKKANGGKRKAEVKVTIFFVQYCYYFYYFFVQLPLLKENFT